MAKRILWNVSDAPKTRFYIGCLWWVGWWLVGFVFW